MEDISDKTVQSYELMLIFLSDIGEDNINKELEELRKYISSNGGKVQLEDSWGNRDLAYRIKKQDKGFYYVMDFTLETSKVGEIQKTLNINPVVIRSLLVKTPENYAYKTMLEYQATDEEEKSIKDEAKRLELAKRQSGPTQKPRSPAHTEKSRPAQPVAKEAKVEKKVEVKEEAHKEEKKVAKKAAAPKVKLEEVDAKLKSIIDDPDIKL